MFTPWMFYIFEFYYQAFADLHGCFDLLATATNYIEGNFTEVLDFDEFYALSADQVINPFPQHPLK
jgi:hypothetical protein